MHFRITPHDMEQQAYFTLSAQQKTQFCTYLTQFSTELVSRVEFGSLIEAAWSHYAFQSYAP